MFQGSLNPKIRFLAQKLWSVARVQTHTHTDRQTDTHESEYWGHPFRVSGFFPSTYHQGSAQKNSTTRNSVTMVHLPDQRFSLEELEPGQTCPWGTVEEHAQWARHGQHQLHWYRTVTVTLSDIRVGRSVQAAVSPRPSYIQWIQHIDTTGVRTHFDDVRKYQYIGTNPPAYAMIHTCESHEQDDWQPIGSFRRDQ